MNPCEFAVEFAAKSCYFDPEFGNVIPVKEYVDRDYLAFYTEVTPMTAEEVVTVDITDRPSLPTLIVIDRDRNEGALPEDSKNPVEAVILEPYKGTYWLGAFYTVRHFEDGVATTATGEMVFYRRQLSGKNIRIMCNLCQKDDSTGYCVELYCDDPASDKYCFAVGCTYRIWAVCEK